MAFQDLTVVFGGSFDPPHLGHARAIGGLLEVPGLRKVLVIPAAQSPLKSGVRATNAQRLELVRLLLNDTLPKALADGRVEVLDLELERARQTPGPSYTYDTVQELRAKGYARLGVVVGTDQLLDLPRWHRWTDLIQQVVLIVLKRQGQPQAALEAGLRAIPEALRSRIQALPTPAPEVSSTHIREAIAKTGQIPTQTLSPSVERQLKAWGLYGIEVPQ